MILPEFICENCNKPIYHFENGWAHGCGFVECPWPVEGVAKPMQQQYILIDDGGRTFPLRVDRVERELSSGQLREVHPSPKSIIARNYPGAKFYQVVLWNYLRSLGLSPIRSRW